MRKLVGAVGIELLINFTKSHVFTVLPTADQMNWSQMELNEVSNGLAGGAPFVKGHLAFSSVHQGCGFSLGKCVELVVARCAIPSSSAIFPRPLRLCRVPRVRRWGYEPGSGGFHFSPPPNSPLPPHPLRLCVTFFFLRTPPHHVRILTRRVRIQHKDPHSTQ